MDTKKAKSILLFTYFSHDQDCDYVYQTIRVLKEKYRVIEIYCPQTTSWKDTWQVYVKKEKNYVRISLPRILFFRKLPIIKRIDKIVSLIVVKIILNLLTANNERIFWTFYPQLTNTISFLKKNHELLAYDVVDIYKKNRIDTTDTICLLKHATLVTTIAESAKKYLFSLYKRKIAVVPQGFDIAAMPHRKSSTKKYIAGYLGAINGRLDLDLLITVAKNLHKEKFLLIGKVENDDNAPLLNTKKFNRLLNQKNVNWIGHLSRKKALEVLQECHVGLIPYDSSLLFNQTSYPMKVFEYLWLGLPVLSCTLPELQRLKKYVKLSNDPDTWKSYLLSCQESPLTDKKILEQQKLAESQRWENKVGIILDYLTKV